MEKNNEPGNITRHPIQPLVRDEHEVVRFKANKIVQYLLDNGGIDMNQISRLNFSREDQEQFAQLIGYSHSGAHDLPYMSDGVLEEAARIYTMQNNNIDQKDAMINHLQGKLRTIKEKLIVTLEEVTECEKWFLLKILR